MPSSGRPSHVSSSLQSTLSQISALLAPVAGDKPDKRKFKAYPLGYFHIDIAEVRTEQGKLYLLVAI